MPIRYEFEKELNELHRNLVKMGSTIEKQIDDMIKAMLNQDVELAREVIKRDDIIDEMERVIEQECIMLIARQQPIASDLRDIASILKIITDLERIADHCEDISEYTIKLSEETYFKPLEDIPIMAYKVKDMIKAVIDSCVSRNLARAEEVKAMDDEIDDLFDSIIEELQGYMAKDSTVVKQCTDFMFIVKYLERMGDHATNISEWIAYNITGKHFE